MLTITAHLWWPLTYLPFAGRRWQAAVCAAILLPLRFVVSFIWPLPCPLLPHPHSQMLAPQFLCFGHVYSFVSHSLEPTLRPASTGGVDWNGMGMGMGMAHSSLSQRLQCGDFCSCLARMEALSAARRRLKPLRTWLHGVWLCGALAKAPKKNSICCWLLHFGAIEARFSGYIYIRS